MPLGTLDRTPPPFFKQGPSALSKLMVFSALALFLMVADTRFKLTQPLRDGVAMVLYPVQRALLVPLNAWRHGQEYLMGLQHAQSMQSNVLQDMAGLAERASRADQLVTENAQLRSLLNLRPAMTVRSQAAEILYEASDAYSRKVIIDAKSGSNGNMIYLPLDKLVDRSTRETDATVTARPQVTVESEGTTTPDPRARGER